MILEPSAIGLSNEWQYVLIAFSVAGLELSLWTVHRALVIFTIVLGLDLGYIIHPAVSIIGSVLLNFEQIFLFS
jgi:hypothetical protein